MNTSALGAFRLINWTLVAFEKLKKESGGEKNCLHDRILQFWDQTLYFLNSVSTRKRLKILSFFSFSRTRFQVFYLKK